MAPAPRSSRAQIDGTEEAMRVAIIGGGISGLATAFYVKRLQPGWDVTILERQPHLGGTMHTVTVDGFLFETGSNGFLSNKPHTLDLVEESGASGLLVRSSDAARIRYIYTDSLHRLPESPKAFLGTRLLSLRGKLRVLGEVLVPPKRDAADETLQSFGYRRVGREFTDVFLNAMSAGIYGSAPEVLSVKAAFPAVVGLEQDYGGLFRGMIKKKTKKAGPGGVLMSFAGGVGRFVEHLAGAVAAEILTDTPVAGLRRERDVYRVAAGDRERSFDKVILATPAYVSAALLGALDAEMASRLGEIEYSPISVVGLGYRDLSHPLNGFGLLTTASARKEILGVLWDSSIFPDRAPAGQKSLRVMIGGQRNPDLALLDDDALLAIALRGVRETMGVDATPDVTFVQRWERGIPNYRPGHLANVDAVFERLGAWPGLYLNSNAYYGIGVNDCVANSRRCAEQVAADD
jgi:oxygen-dependent protoporphyrinogen oxidase